MALSDGAPQELYSNNADGDVTWTCTFNGRIDSFFEALESFVAACKPATLRRIRDWIVIADSGANTEHRVAIMRRAPWLTLICKGPSMHGHARSLNMLTQLVRTKWWVQWEDDWRIDSRRDGPDIIERALEAAMSSHCRQVALNGAFLDGDEADYEICRKGDYAVVGLSATARTVFLSDLPAEDVAKAVAPLRTRDAKPPPWPLFSLQPSLLDANFVKTYVSPFAETTITPEAYWLWELQAAICFVRAGGTKASLSSPPFATQITVASSSCQDDYGPIGVQAQNAPRRKFAWKTAKNSS